MPQKNIYIYNNAVIRKKKNLTLYILLAAVVLAVAAVSIYYFITSGKDTNAKDLYFQIESKNFVNYMNEVEKKQDKSAAIEKLLREQPSRTRHEISVKLSQSDSQGGSGFSLLNLPQQAIDVINSIKIVTSSKYDIKNNKKADSLSFLLQGQSFIDINTFWDNDTVGFQIPVIYDKYFVFNKNSLSEVLAKFGIDIPVKQVVSVSDITGSLDFSAKEFKDAIEDYIQFLRDNITDRQVSMTKNIKPELQDEQQGEGQNSTAASGKYDMFVLTMDEDRFKDIAIKTIDMFCTDKRLFNMTFGKIFPVIDMLNSAGYFDLAETLEGLPGQVSRYEDMEKLKQDLTSAIEKSSFPEGFSMTVIVNKNGNIVDRKVSFSQVYPNQYERWFSLHSGPLFMNLVIEQGESKNNPYNARIEIKHQEEEGTGTSHTYINCVNNLWPDFELAVNKEKQTSTNDKDKVINTSYTLDLDLTCKDLNINNANILVSIQREDRYGIEFQLPSLNENTAIDLNMADEDAINKVMAEIQFSAAKFLLTNQYLLNAFTY